MQANMYLNVHSRSVHDRPKLERTHMFIRDTINIQLHIHTVAWLAMRINKLQLDASIWENLTSIMFNKRKQMQWSTYYMIPCILTFKSRQLIDGNESQIGGYHWGEGTCRNPWSSVSWFEWWINFMKIQIWLVLFLHLCFTWIKSSLKSTYDMSKLGDDGNTLYFKCDGNYIHSLKLTKL